MTRLVALAITLICLAFPTGIAYGACNSTDPLDQELDQGTTTMLVMSVENPEACSQNAEFKHAALPTTRQYDPSAGKFLSPDPIMPDTEDPYASSYIYANNRPGVLTDPSGESPFPWAAYQQVQKVVDWCVKDPQHVIGCAAAAVAAYMVIYWAWAAAPVAVAVAGDVLAGEAGEGLVGRALGGALVGGIAVGGIYVATHGGGSDTSGSGGTSGDIGTNVGAATGTTSGTTTGDPGDEGHCGDDYRGSSREDAFDRAKETAGIAADQQPTGEGPAYDKRGRYIRGARCSTHGRC
jgi:RHS repeat-associated protein